MHFRTSTLSRKPAAADPKAHVMQAIGVDLDLVEKGLGVRSRRYAMLVDDGTVRMLPSGFVLHITSEFHLCCFPDPHVDALCQVTDLNLEEGGAFTTSGAEGILAVL